MKFLALLNNRWFFGVLGLLALSLVIWLVGPLLAIGEARPLATRTAQLIAMLLLILGWLLVMLIQTLRQQRAARALTAGMVETAVSPSASENGAPEQAGADPTAASAQLKGRFEEALKLLKTVRTRDGGRLNVYDLPWYVIIGPPGSGKTTALRNSGLHFPLADRLGDSALRGVGGTRNCDWWFTDDAVLLDTAGRYLTQDSDPDSDQAEWRGFLGLLKRHRPRQPVNGVLLSISLPDLLGGSADERARTVRAMRTRIQELYEQLGVRVPIYVLLTKADLLSGFVEHFGSLGQQAREQVWGFTFELDDPARAEDPLAGLAQEFDVLVARLNEQLFARVDQERDLLRRGVVYEFPAQLASLKEPLLQFLSDVFTTTRFDQPPFVRGVYLTSGTQEGAPFDRLLGHAARAFGGEARAFAAGQGEQRSYFLTGLLQSVIFPEAGLAGTNRRVERRFAQFRIALYAALALVSIALGLGWAGSYLRNQAYLQTVDTHLERSEAEIAGLAAQSEPLAPLVLAIAHLERGPDLPESAWWGAPGLSQQAKVSARLEQSAQRLREQQLLPQLVQELERALGQRLTRSDDDAAYVMLRYYLMLGDPERYDGEALSAWLAAGELLRPSIVLTEERTESVGSAVAAGTNVGADVSTDSAAPPTFASDWRAQVGALFQTPPLALPLALDQSLINDTRQRLRNASMAERAYAMIRGSVDLNRPGFSVTGAAGADARLVFVRPSGESLAAAIPAYYSRDGYLKEFLPQSARWLPQVLRDQWVLGDQAGAAPSEADLAARVEDLYLTEFTERYEALLNDLTLATFGNPDQASRLLAVLAGDESPLLRLIGALNTATDLETPTAALGTVIAGSTAALNQVDAVQDQLSRVGARGLSSALGRLTRVESRFRGIRRFAPDAEGTPSPALTRIQELIKELYATLTLVASEQSRGGVPPHIQDQTKSTVRKLEVEAGSHDGLVARMLEGLAEQTTGITSGGIANYLNNEWRGQPLKFCQDAIANRYPLQRAAERDVRLDDFTSFFGPDGVMDQFFSSYLKPYVDTARSPWRIKDGIAPGTFTNAASLRQFERAAAIRAAFFRDGSSPSVRFELVPRGMDQGYTRFDLTVDGQKLSYSFGPKVVQRFDWPGDGRAEATARVQMASGESRVLFAATGPWGWFRLLDQSRLNGATGGEQFALSLGDAARPVDLELRATSAYNPFSLAALGQFRCPTSI